VQWHALTDELADATFTHPQTGEVRIDWDMKRAMTAFGKKDMYAKFPRQMLRSRVVSEGVRTLWPLATSGMYEPGEAADIPAVHNGPTIEATNEPTDARKALNAQIPLRPAAAATPRAERRVDPTPYEADPRETDEERWKRNLLAKLAIAKSRADVVAVGALKSVHAAQAAGIPELAVWVTKALNEAFARFPADETEAVDDDLGEVVIAGEEKIGAGD
jgi:hypothetical protein